MKIICYATNTQNKIQKSYHHLNSCTGTMWWSPTCPHNEGQHNKLKTNIILTGQKLIKIPITSRMAWLSTFTNVIQYKTESPSFTVSSSRKKERVSKLGNSKSNSHCWWYDVIIGKKTTNGQRKCSMDSQWNIINMIKDEILYLAKGWIKLQSIM